MTQCERIINYMHTFGSITTFQAFTDLGCTRLASRINDIRNSGIPIQSEFVTSRNRMGEKVAYKKYWIED